jgi:hypothetical protein
MTKERGWVVKNITVGNVFVPPESQAEQARRLAYEAVAAARHRARFARTIMGGPGNQSSIHGCYCGESYNRYDRTQPPPVVRYAAHIGSDVRLVQGVLAVGDAFYDAIDHPGDTLQFRPGVTMQARLEEAVADLSALTSNPAIVEAARGVLGACTRADGAMGRLYDLILEKRP